ncbi:MAG: N-alpha-acetyl-L-2,4-diaminobutyric acid deacetylase [Chlamydiia bacterium]|nr:N-alpha-acetyl-L-2,4-diaminobutyric acid deacetylase [Chlamydiia bacterium]
MNMGKNTPLNICNTVVQPGENLTLGLPTPEMYGCVRMHVPVHIFHGRREGPVLLVCSALHGDEVNGISIIHKLLNLRLLKGLQGTLIAIPVVNVFGLLSQSRYLPDRRDLNGSFPGAESGNYTERMAHTLTKEIIAHATHIIDIHSGEPGVKKLSQVETLLSDEKAHEMARMFGAPIMLDNPECDTGMLWNLQGENPKPTLVFNGGGANQLDEMTVKTGLKGIVRVMKGLGMLGFRKEGERKTPEPMRVESKAWLKTPKSGLCHFHKRIGGFVKKGEVVAEIYDPFGPAAQSVVTADREGVIIAKYEMPLVTEGDGIVAVGTVSQAHLVSSASKAWEEDSQGASELE